MAGGPRSGDTLTGGYCLVTLYNPCSSASFGVQGMQRAIIPELSESLANTSVRTSSRTSHCIAVF